MSLNIGLSDLTSAATSAIAEAQASANATITVQNALAKEQNEVALDQAENAVAEELGKGVKALVQ